MRFDFGPHELDTERFELRRNGILVSIQLKALELIVYLARNRERVVSQDELLAALWPDTAVTSASLARAVSVARRALDDTSNEPQAIRTIPRRGYRFVAPLKGNLRSNGADDLDSSYVGRRLLLERARDALDAGLAGRGRIFLLVGEAGIGKTRTAELLVEWSRVARAEIATAWALVHAAPTYLCWTSVLSQLVDADPRAFDSLSSAQRAHLARILPDHATGGKVIPSEVGEAARIRLFESVLAFLTRAARRRPLVLFFDDLHATDAESMALLDYVGRSIGALPIVIIATCREDDVMLAPQQARAFERVLRAGPTERWSLTGLHADELVQFVSRALGRSAHPDLIAALERKTGGNPLLLGESLRSLGARALLDEERAQGEWERLLPRGIEHLIRPKLQQVSDEVLDLLACASAIGLEVDRELLFRSLPANEDFDARLREVVDVGLLAMGPGGTPIRFTHALVRDAVYNALVSTETSRRALHARIWMALEDRGTRSGARIAEVARHACEAAAVADPRRAADLACEAAKEAALLFDFEGACQWYARALEAQAHCDPPDLSQRAAIELGFAGATARSMGLERARGAYQIAADTARTARRPDLLALAALGFAQRPNSAGQGDSAVVAVLEESLKALPADAIALRVRVASRLAAELRYSDRDRMVTLAERALADARKLGDSLVLAQTLDDRTFIAWSPSDPGAWVSLNSEAAEYARLAGDVDLEISGHKGCVSGLLELGDLAGALQVIRKCERIAKATPIPYARWWFTVFQASRMLIEGDLVRAEELILESIRIAERIDSPEIAIELNAQLFYLRKEQGRASEIEAPARAQVRAFPQQPLWRAALARILVAGGELTLARQEIAPFFEGALRGGPIDRTWPGTHALAAEVVAAVRDERAAAVLEEALRPFASRAIVVGSALYYGPASHFLGMLAATQSRWEPALAHFEAALVSERQMGAQLFAARTKLETARALLARDAKGDRVRAARLASEVLEVSESRGFALVAQEGRTLDSAIWEHGRTGGRDRKRPARQERGR